MKKYLLIFLMICAYATADAQQLIVKSVNLRPQDARARTNPREDARGKKCAIIRVGVVGVEDIVFPDAVGNVERSLSEYVVYVADGLKSLRYNNKAGQLLGTINFDDYGLEINSLASYDVILESSNHLRSAVFSIQPPNATLTFDGKKVEVKSDGIAMINKPAGEYSYKVEAKGYISQSGKVVLTEDDMSTITDVVLEEHLHPVSIIVFPNNASVFIDNIPYSKESMVDLKLPEGRHTIRVTAADFQDEERTINVKASMAPKYIVLKGIKQKVVEHREEQSKTRISIRDAFYFTGGFEAIFVNDAKGFSIGGIKADASFIPHFLGAFALRVGVGLGLHGIAYSDDFDSKELLEDSVTHVALDAPIQLGISMPFGKYNKHLFSVFAGGYGRASFLCSGHKEAEMFKEKLGEDHFELGDYYDYGLRASFKLDISKFTIGADLSKSLKGYGFSGCIILGVKMYYL